MADHSPAVKRQGDAGHAAKKIGHRALFRKAAGIIAEIGDHGLQLPIAEKDGILKALGPGGKCGRCGARMRRHGTIASRSAILGEDSPPLRRTGLESANERAQGLGQGLAYEDDEMEMLGHQLLLDDLHLREKARHFHQRLDHRLAERRGLNAGSATGGGNCGARMRRHGTIASRSAIAGELATCLAILGEVVLCLAILGED